MEMAQSKLLEQVPDAGLPKTMLVNPAATARGELLPRRSM